MGILLAARVKFAVRTRNSISILIEFIELAVIVQRIQSIVCNVQKVKEY